MNSTWKRIKQLLNYHNGMHLLVNSASADFMKTTQLLNSIKGMQLLVLAKEMHLLIAPPNPPPLLPNFGRHLHAPPPCPAAVVIGLVPINFLRRIRSWQNPSDILVQIDGGIAFPVVDLIRRSTAAYNSRARFPMNSGWSQAPRRQQGDNSNILCMFLLFLLYHAAGRRHERRRPPVARWPASGRALAARLLHAGWPCPAATRNMLHGGRTDVRHDWRTVLRGSAALGAAACGHAPHAMLAAAAVRRLSDSVATVDFF
ncbi:hypothetical protein F511_22239 [Dorcoceras hygrometricum]|uniref:Uncharacterized protein n=1 Tax=Dorcoceras hygrometricum TaxID=472368 RepID=A0A2Z7C908_9LAMI|nr:hypothetical protein F511_22239 [Dorcoceras hygrometricum]